MKALALLAACLALALATPSRAVMTGFPHHSAPHPHIQPAHGPSSHFHHRQNDETGLGFPQEMLDFTPGINVPAVVDPAVVNPEDEPSHSASGSALSRWRTRRGPVLGAAHPLHRPEAAGSSQFAEGHIRNGLNAGDLRRPVTASFRRRSLRVRVAPRVRKGKNISPTHRLNLFHRTRAVLTAM